jgi:hypothetical protein
MLIPQTPARSSNDNSQLSKKMLAAIFFFAYMRLNMNMKLLKPIFDEIYFPLNSPMDKTEQNMNEL